MCDYVNTSVTSSIKYNRAFILFFLIFQSLVPFIVNMHLTLGLPFIKDYVLAVTRKFCERCLQYENELISAIGNYDSRQFRLSMKCITPEIAWHNREPVLSIDIQLHDASNDTSYRLASAGADSHIIMWRIECNIQYKPNEITKIDCIADLNRHQKAVNVVRFSPSSELLASGDDESVIIIWKKRDSDCPDFSDLESDQQYAEQWICKKTLRLHMEDVYDLSWSSDSTKLISASVDNTAIIWNVSTGQNLGILKSHKGFVQGVSWDPLNQFIATLSSDRTCRVFSANTQNIVSKCSKAVLPSSSSLHCEDDHTMKKIYHDDTLKTYFRRLCFSPDGNLLITPSGFIESTSLKQQTNATFVFLRNSFQQPVMYYPSGKEYTIVVRCCPLLFKLKDTCKNSKLFNFPYRMIIAVATKKSVLLYDTEHAAPFAYVTDMHYTRLTDICWSHNGRLLAISSTDGYCTFVTFTEGELGEIYVPDKNESELNNVQ